jgi:hypothetical protein
VRDLSHYGDPPRKPRDESRRLRIAARIILLAAGLAVAASLVAGLLGWQ